MDLSKYGRHLNRVVADYTVFDFETTGVDPHEDAIIEISAVKVRDGEIVSEFSTLVNPRMHIPFEASMVNHIMDEMVEDSPFIETALEEFLEFAGEDILVGHNIAAFDLKFLYRDAERIMNKIVGNDYVDTLILARQYLSDLPSRSLSNLAIHYGISADGAHRALNDCIMNQKIYVNLGVEMRKARENGVRTCPLCGQVLKKRKGKFGEFWGCSGYPACRYTENIR